MFIYAHNELLNDKDYNEAYNLYLNHNNNELYPNESLIKPIKDKVCQMYGINIFYLDHLLSVSDNDDLLGIFSYILKGETNFTKTDIQNIIKEKIKDLEALQNTQLGKEKNKSTNNIILLNKHMHYFVWDENIKTKLVGIIISNIDNYTDKISLYNKILPCQEELLLELVDENRFDLDILQKLFLAAMKAGFNNLSQNTLNILIKEKKYLNKNCPFVAYATKYARYEILKRLLDENIDVSIKNHDYYSKTALMYAVIYNDIKLITTLLDKDTNIEAKDKDGTTALMWAAVKNNDKVTKLLVDKCANIEARDRDGNTALMWAAAKNCTKTIQILFNNHANIDAKNKKGESALIFASKEKENNINAIQELIIKGAKTEEKDNNGNTALIWATFYNKIQAIRALINNNTDIEAKNKNEETALIVAAKENNISALKELIIQGANIEARNKNGETALILAAKENNISVLKKLIICGADIEARNKNGETALILATKFNNNEAIKQLIISGADIEYFYIQDFDSYENHLKILDTIDKLYISINRIQNTTDTRIINKVYKSQFNLTIGYLSYILLSDKSTSFWDLTEVLT